MKTKFSYADLHSKSKSIDKFFKILIKKFSFVATLMFSFFGIEQKPIRLPFPNLLTEYTVLKILQKWVSKPFGIHVLANMAKDLAAGKATYLPNQTNILSIHCDFLFTTVVLAPTNMVSSVNTS